MRAVADGAYANLELPKELRGKGIHGRDAGFATELTYGATRLHGLYDPIIAAAAGRPVAQIDDNVLDTLRLGAHQLLGMRVAAHAAVDETVGARADGQRCRCQRLRQRGDAPDQREGPADLGRAGRARPATRSPGWRSCTATRSGSCGRCGRRSSATVPPPPRRSTPTSRPCWWPTTRPPRSPSWPGPVWPTSTSSSRPAPRGRCSHRSGRSWTAATPAASRPCATDARRCRTRARQLVALALSRAPTCDRADGGVLARPVRRPGRQGRAAGRAGARGRAPTLFANEVSEHRTDLVRQTLSGAIDAGIEVMVGTGDGRDIGAGRARDLRPGPGRRAVHRAGGAATPPRGALASYDRGPRRPRRAAAGAAGLGDRRHPARRRRRLRHLQPAPQRDPVRRRRRAQEALGRRACWTPGRCSPTPPVRRSPHLGEGPYVQLLAAPARHRRDVPRPAA